MSAFLFNSQTQTRFAVSNTVNLALMTIGYIGVRDNAQNYCNCFFFLVEETKDFDAFIRKIIEKGVKYTLGRFVAISFVIYIRRNTNVVTMITTIKKIGTIFMRYYFKMVIFYTRYPKRRTRSIQQIDQLFGDCGDEKDMRKSPFSSAPSNVIKYRLFCFVISKIIRSSTMPSMHRTHLLICIMDL